MLNQSYLTWIVAIVPNAAVIDQKLDMLSGDNVGKHPCLIYTWITFKAFSQLLKKGQPVLGNIQECGSNAG